MADKSSTDTGSTKTTSAKKVKVTNLWNQVTPIYLSDGSERNILARDNTTIDESQVSKLMKGQQSRGIIRIDPVK